MKKRVRLPKQRVRLYEGRVRLYDGRVQAPFKQPIEYCCRCGNPRLEGETWFFCSDRPYCTGVYITAGQSIHNIISILPLPERGYWNGPDQQELQAINNHLDRLKSMQIENAEFVHVIEKARAEYVRDLLKKWLTSKHQKGYLKYKKQILKSAGVLFSSVELPKAHQDAVAFLEEKSRPRWEHKEIRKFEQLIKEAKTAIPRNG